MLEFIVIDMYTILFYMLKWMPKNISRWTNVNLIYLDTNIECITNWLCWIILYLATQSKIMLKNSEKRRMKRWLNTIVTSYEINDFRKVNKGTWKDLHQDTRIFFKHIMVTSWSLSKNYGNEKQMHRRKFQTLKLLPVIHRLFTCLGNIQ